MLSNYKLMAEMNFLLAPGSSTSPPPLPDSRPPWGNYAPRDRAGGASLSCPARMIWTGILPSSLLMIFHYHRKKCL